MKRIKKIGKWTLGILVGLFLLILGAMYYFEPEFIGAPKVTKKIFDEAGFPFERHETDWRSRKLNWIETGNSESDHLIFFLHGAPGSWADYSSYLTDSSLQSRSLMVSMDRPGYGGSGYGKSEPSILKQVEAAREILSHYQPDTVIIVGYSYGGPVAGALASSYGGPIKSVLLLAPVIDPDHERIFWFNHLFKNRLSKFIFPHFIGVANDEKMGHSKALAEIEKDWKNIGVPITHLHCTDDWIAPFKANTGFIRERIPNGKWELISWTGDNHFLPNQQMDRILPVMSNMLD